MLKTAEGSLVIAEAVRDCGVEVVAAYPITSSTHIAHQLDKYYADGLIPKFIAVESEFAAMSALQGASAGGARAFTTTSGQGLLLMHEVLHSMAGMRLPVVACVANRAVSSPLSIWNDEQDSMSQRDTGWIQLYCKNNQEAVDTVIQAFRIAEKVMIPAMVCIDGFYLTHSVEQIDTPEPEKIKAFLPPYVNPYVLDPEKPMSLGVYATPPDYQDFREDLSADIENTLPVIEDVGREFGKAFGRTYGLMDLYQCEDADRVMLSLGSITSNIDKVVDKLRAQGEKVGVCHLRAFRPFPREQLRKALVGKHVLIVERDISPGSVPPLYGEVAEALYGTNTTVSYIKGGLGGREVRSTEFERWFAKMKEGKQIRAWMGSNQKAPEQPIKFGSH
jgi:pyruvate ferredoxin oxidoreductase alpha subunit